MSYFKRISVEIYKNGILTYSEFKDLLNGKDWDSLVKFAKTVWKSGAGI